MADMNIRRNARVEAADGEVGRVKHVVVDPGTKEVTDLVVGQDGNEWLVPISAVASVEGERVMLRGPRSQFQRGVAFDRGRYQAVDDEEARDESARRAERGGAPLLDADDDAVHVGGATPAPRPERADVARGRPVRAEHGERLELKEEELRARKQVVETGEVGVRKEIVTETQTLAVPVTHEEVVIERHPVAGERPVSGDIGEGEEIRVPVMEERVTVEKQPVVTEEVVVGRRQVQETERVSDTVRREEARVETEGQVRQVQDEGGTGRFSTQDHEHSQRS